MFSINRRYLLGMNNKIETLFLVFLGLSGILYTLLYYFFYRSIFVEYYTIFMFSFFIKSNNVNNKRFFSTNNKPDPSFIRTFLIKMKEGYLLVKSYFVGPNVFLIGSFIVLFMSLVSNYITFTQCIILLLIVIFLYFLTFTAYYEKLVKFTEEADYSFEEYLKTLNLGAQGLS